MEIILVIIAIIAVCAAMLLKGKAWQSFVDDVTEKNDSKEETK